MCNLVDSALEFWLTAGRYTAEFEQKFAEYLGVRYCSLVNSGSSANLCAFMALTSPLLGERRGKTGRRDDYSGGRVSDYSDACSPVWCDSRIC